MILYLHLIGSIDPAVAHWSIKVVAAIVGVDLYLTFFPFGIVEKWFSDNHGTHNQLQGNENDNTSASTKNTTISEEYRCSSVEEEIIIDLSVPLCTCFC